MKSFVATAAAVPMGGKETSNAGRCCRRPVMLLDLVACCVCPGNHDSDVKNWTKSRQIVRWPSSTVAISTGFGIDGAWPGMKHKCRHSGRWSCSGRDERILYEQSPTRRANSVHSPDSPRDIGTTLFVASRSLASSLACRACGMS